MFEKNSQKPVPTIAVPKIIVYGAHQRHNLQRTSPARLTLAFWLGILQPELERSGFPSPLAACFALFSFFSNSGSLGVCKAIVFEMWFQFKGDEADWNTIQEKES